MLSIALILSNIGVIHVAAQSKPLAGKIILFGTFNQEPDPFDRSENGASRFATLLVQAGASIDRVNWDRPIPSNVDLVILIGMAGGYTGVQTTTLWEYLQNGGNLSLFLEPPSRSNRTQSVNSGLFELLWQDYGIRANDTVLVNPVDGAPPAAPAEIRNAERTPFPTPTAIPSTFPNDLIKELIPLLPEHPILKGISVESIELKTVRPVEIDVREGDDVVEGLLGTSDLIYGESDVSSFVDFNVYHFDAENDTSQRSYLVAGTAIDGATGSRVVIFGDAEIAVNNVGFSVPRAGQYEFVFPDVVKLVLNSVYWALDIVPPDLTIVAASEPTVTPTQTSTLKPTATPAVTVTPTLIPTATPREQPTATP